MLISPGRFTYIFKYIIWSLGNVWFQLSSLIIRSVIILQVGFNSNPRKFFSLLQLSKLCLVLYLKGMLDLLAGRTSFCDILSSDICS